MTEISSATCEHVFIFVWNSTYLSI